jgi:hypothetical protein
LGPIDSASFCLRTERERVSRQILAPSIGPKWVSFIWRQRQNPVSETCFMEPEGSLRCSQDRTMANVQNCDSYVSIWCCLCNRMLGKIMTR